MIHFITDTHFYHKNIAKYTNRPYNHNELMIENWQKKVSPEDSVIHMGDFTLLDSVTKVQEIVEQLPGKITLIRGNHDKLTDEQYLRAGFSAVCTGLLYRGLYFSHFPVRLLPEEAIYNVHGHFHNNPREHWDFSTYEHSRLLAIENVNYEPLTLEELCNHLDISIFSLSRG